MTFDARSMAPPPDPSTLILRELSEAQKLHSWRENSVSWQLSLKTVEDYIARETRNGKSGLAENGGMKYFGFFRPSGGEGKGGGEVVENGGSGEEIFAYVEGQRKQVLVKERDGEVKEEWIWALASVFTPERYRGRKMGTWMMKRLGEWLDEQEGENRFSVLFSDVGGYYSPLGWKTFPSLETTLPAILPTKSKTTSATPLSVSLLNPLYPTDIAHITELLQSHPLTPSTKTLITILPTAAQASWHFGAAEVAAASLRSAPPQALEVRGAITSSGKTWIYWFHDFTESKLSILRLVSLYPPDEDKQAVDELVEVLRAAQVEAGKWKFGKLVIWTPDERTFDACRVCLDAEEPKVRVRTEGSIPCVRWKGGDAANEEGWEKKVQWLWCEKFAWC